MAGGLIVKVLTWLFKSGPRQVRGIERGERVGTRFDVTDTKNF